MDPLDFLEDDELLLFFRFNKPEMSCVENPHTFIQQLKTHNLVPESRYQLFCEQKLSHMRSKDRLKTAFYDLLDWLERNRSQHIKEIWRCVFRDTIMNQYLMLRLLHKSLMDVLDEMEEEDLDDRKRKELSEEEEEKPASSARKKKKRRRQSRREDEEEKTSTSSQPQTPGRQKNSPLKKGEKSEIWTQLLFKSQLPVTCGEKTGSLSRERLSRGEKCIAVGKKWFTPSEFEKYGGKGSYKNWKLSVKCNDTPLKTLIEDGHLKSVRFKGGCKKAKKDRFPSDDLISVDEDQTEEAAEEQPDAGPDISNKVFKVTCGAEAATLHMKRFASGRFGKSIRTEMSWMTPVEFVKSCQIQSSWKKAIEWEGNPISSVITEKWLHSLLCPCPLCKPSAEDKENQKNDDECFICKDEDDDCVVVCDQCPRSFHPKCHLPHIDDAILRDERPWNCTFCEFRIAQQLVYSEEQEREAVMSGQISQKLLGCQYLLLFLQAADEEQMFVYDPNAYLTDYATLIKTPMWLKKLEVKLQEQLYQTVGEFVSDVELIFSNCASYYRDNDEFLTLGNKLKEQFDRELKRGFKICE